jgi:hypothetical protein
MKKVSISDAGVPFVISFRKILRKPKMTRERRFVGPLRIVKNLLVKAIEVFEDVAFETKIEEVEPGKSVAVHWAVTIPDAFDTSSGIERNLMAFRMLNDMPPCGAHFEIISPLKEEALTPEQAAAAKAAQKTNLAYDLSPEQFEKLRQHQEQQALLHETKGVNGGFVRPPNPAYETRPVKTLDEEIADGVGDEEPASVDGASSLGEDN